MKKMARENKTLGIVIIVLVLTNLGVYFLRPGTGDLSFNEEKFAITDTSGIQSVTFIGNEQQIKLEVSPDGWQVNNQYPVDRRLKNILFSVLRRVRVRKPVDVSDSSGMKVEIRGDQPGQFIVFSNPTKTRTYFYDPEEEQGYEVEIPGYNEYIGAIFELKKDQWRDRLMINESSRTIQHLSLRYPAEPSKDVELLFDENFYQVNELDEFDTTFLFDYLDQFQHFEANERISGDEFPQYDSLTRTTVLAVVEIESINRPEPLIFRIYPSLRGQDFHLISDQSGELLIVDRKRVQQLLVEPSDFKVKPVRQ